MHVKSDKSHGFVSLAEDANYGAGELGPWYMYLNYKDHPAYANVSDEMKVYAEQFMRDGFIIFENDVSEDLCDNIVSGFYNFIEKNDHYFNNFKDEYGRLQRIINLHLAYTPLLKLFSRASKSIKFQDALFGEETSIYTSLYYERGSTQEIHRDTPYFTTRPEHKYFGTWFALEDANTDNGCLEVIRGGHLINEVDRKRFALTMSDNSDERSLSINQKFFDNYQQTLIDTAAEAGLLKEAVPVKKGSVLIWHPQLPHGGSSIRRDGASRHSIVMHTTPVGTPVYQAFAFFDPSSELPEKSAWHYGNYEGRQHVLHNQIEVMHREPRPIDYFMT